MNLFSKQEIKNGILIETLSPSFQFVNPSFYQSMVTGGGAMAIRLGKPLPAQPGLEVTHSQIVILRDIVDLLTKEELDAVIAHEAAHITNGDTMMDIKLGKNFKIVSILDRELKADEAGAAVHGGMVMISALDKMITFQCESLLRTKNKVIISIFTYLANCGDMKKRRKALTSQISK